jgi:hypothetical protein
MEGDVEVYRRLSRALRGPYSLAPILMTGGLLLALTLTLGPKSPVADAGLVTALMVAMLGGLMEFYYMILLNWASNATRGGGLSLREVVYALASIGLYYTLIGIAMLSMKVNEYSRTLACNCNSSVPYSIITLGVHLARSQTCLSACASTRMEELLLKTQEGIVGGRESRRELPQPTAHESGYMKGG